MNAKVAGWVGWGRGGEGGVRGLGGDVTCQEPALAQPMDAMAVACQEPALAQPTATVTCCHPDSDTIFENKTKVIPFQWQHWFKNFDC